MRTANVCISDRSERGKGLSIGEPTFSASPWLWSMLSLRQMNLWRRFRRLSSSLRTFVMLFRIILNATSFSVINSNLKPRRRKRWAG